MVVYIKVRKDDHFSVLRGISGNMVWLADPSLGLKRDMDFLIALIEIFYPGAIDLASKTKKRRVRRLFTGVGSIFIVVAAVFLFLSFFECFGRECFRACIDYPLLVCSVVIFYFGISVLISSKRKFSDRRDGRVEKGLPEGVGSGVSGGENVYESVERNGESGGKGTQRLRMVRSNGVYDVSQHRSCEITGRYTWVSAWLDRKGQVVQEAAFAVSVDGARFDVRFDLNGVDVYLDLEGRVERFSRSDFGSLFFPVLRFILVDRNGYERLLMLRIYGVCTFKLRVYVDGERVNRWNGVFDYLGF